MTPRSITVEHWPNSLGKSRLDQCSGVITPFQKLRIRVWTEAVETQPTVMPALVVSVKVTPGGVVELLLLIIRCCFRASDVR